MSPSSLPASAQIVIIGGGVIGCSTAYHLAKAGCRDVILLERSKLTSGTTWHSAAMVRQLRSTPSLTALAKYSAELYQSLEAETGQSTGWIGCGSISIATNPDRMIHIQRQASLAKAFDVPVEPVTAEEIEALWPIANTSDIIGGIYSPSDGRVGPSDLCAALARGAKARGVRIFEDTAVTGFTFHDGRITGVRVGERTISCETTVIAAGLWSRELARMAGAAVPLQACEHYALITHHFEGIRPGMPILGDHDNHMYIRDEGGGLLVGAFEPNARAIDVSRLPAEFSFSLLQEDWDHFESIMGGALHRIPALETAQIKLLLNGPESFTLDNNFILGPAPETPGLFLCCGMNSVGVASGGGAGRALAEWIVDGEPGMDLLSIDARRFPRLRNSLAALKERAPEVLSGHYKLHRFGNEWHTARPGRTTPLYQRHVAAGAVFGDRAGWERAVYFDPEGSGIPYEPSSGRPDWYCHVLAEQAAAREAVAVFDQSPLGKVLVQGRDAESFLDRVCVGNMAMEPGTARYTLALNRRGGIEAEWIVLRIGNRRFLLLTGSGQVTRDLHLLNTCLGADEFVTFTDVTAATAVLSVMGPRSRELLAGMTDAELGDEGFPFSTHREIEVGGVVVRAVRVSYIGGLGWELHAPVETAGLLYDRLHAAGKPLGLRDAGAYALDALRIERGICSFGHDIGPGDAPLEAGLGFVFDPAKERDFIGKEALLAQKARGVARRRVLVATEDPGALLLGGEPIYVNGELLGYTTSGGWSRLAGAAVGMGYIQTKGQTASALLDGARVELLIAEKRFAARASLKPFASLEPVKLRAAE